MQYRAFFLFLALSALLAATRTIAVTPETTSVHVVGDDVVPFVAAGK